MFLYRQSEKTTYTIPRMFVSKRYVTETERCATGFASAVGQHSGPNLLNWKCDNSSWCPMNAPEHWQSQWHTRELVNLFVRSAIVACAENRPLANEHIPQLLGFAASIRPDTV